MKNALLLYGAYGYTGRLITQIAKQQNCTIILAGRDAQKLEAMSRETGFAWRAFSLSNVDQVAAALSDVQVVLHAAGPFIFTAENMLNACIKSGTHYLDITGEIDVFEMAAALHEQAVQANIMLMPGTGFDVVPTDCMALSLKKALPDATHLKLAFGTRGGGVSHGTATSMVNKLGGGGAERVNGKLVPAPLGERSLEVEVEGFRMFTMSIPWGDLSTAWRTTGIPNITTYTRMSKTVYYSLKAQFLFNWLLRTNWIRNRLRKRIDAGPAGPSDEQRQRSRSFIYGKVSNAEGQIVEAGFSAPEGYTLTALASFHIAQKVMNGQWKPGYQTPAGCYGEQLVFELPNTSSWKKI
ncbi:MAG TPA: saccharopine dehydrogenase NADP-binding domain-containing protein [Phnomibacter sp.]|nr:saccharopine dehydrogenase NADP-binding domain-containing protein [Phnomibacter sp.]